MEDWPWTKVEFDISDNDMDALANALFSEGFKHSTGGRHYEWFAYKRREEVKAQLKRMGLLDYEFRLIRCRPRAGA